jgi:DNA-binding NarL/FixJ family response regulator
VTALVVAEDEVVRLGLRLLLRNMPAVRDVVEALGVYDAIRLADAADYDVVVMDLPRAQAAGYALIDRLAALRPEVLFVLYTDDAGGAARYCHEKRLRCACAPRGPESGLRLARAVESVVAPGPVGPHRPGCVHEESNPGMTPGAQLIASLTARERSVLSLVAAGRSSKDIAAALGVSLRTVESHRSAICSKLGVRTVADLTKIAVKAGLTSLEHDAVP